MANNAFWQSMKKQMLIDDALIVWKHAGGNYESFCKKVTKSDNPKFVLYGIESWRINPDFFNRVELLTGPNGKTIAKAMMAKHE